MNRFSSSIMAGLVGLVVVLGLCIALASAGASLANGVANAAASTALMTSQCLAAFMVIIALAAGSVLGANVFALMQSRKSRPQQPQFQRFPAAYYRQLPPALDYLALPAPKDEDDDDELTKALVGLFKDSPL